MISLFNPIPNLSKKTDHEQTQWLGVIFSWQGQESRVKKQGSLLPGMVNVKNWVLPIPEAKLTRLISMLFKYPFILFPF